MEWSRSQSVCESQDNLIGQRVKIDYGGRIEIFTPTAASPSTLFRFRDKAVNILPLTDYGSPSRAFRYLKPLYPVLTTFYATRFVILVCPYNLFPLCFSGYGIVLSRFRGEKKRITRVTPLFFLSRWYASSYFVASVLFLVLLFKKEPYIKHLWGACTQYVPYKALNLRETLQTDAFIYFTYVYMYPKSVG